MTYKETLDYLFSQLPMFSRVGAPAYKPGLETSLALDAYFGHPHRKFKSIHVAGTNGKGSTSHTLASILREEGYKVGLYTSPHLADFRERIRVNGEMIPERSVVDFVEKWKTSGYDGHPSFFELTMMMAFCYFAEQNVDYAVIEVGMGGRLDSTNIISPIACVITNISPDHTQFLGDTLPKIAAEKAGIIKPGIPVVIGKAEGEVRKVFEQKALLEGSEVTFASEEQLGEFTVTPELTMRIVSSELGTFHSPLGGDYQKENLNTVLHAVRMLKKAGVGISGSSVVKGIGNTVANTGLMGRWMVVSKTPLTICDTGHNLAGLTMTMSQLENLRRLRNARALRFVIGFVSDKDVTHIAGLLPADGIYYVTNAGVPRAMPAHELLRILTEKGLRCIPTEGGVAGAAAMAVSDAHPEDIVYVGGSTFVVADYLAALKS